LQGKLFVRKQKTGKHHSKNKQCKTSEHNHKDDAINDTCLLSDLHKPAERITNKTDKHGQTQKQSKRKNLSPILFVKTQLSTGKMKRQTKIRFSKALVDTGATTSITTSLESAKGLPLSNKTETKKWSTAAPGMLKTSAKTKRLEFSLPELHSNRKIEKSLHIVDVELKN
jgi:hypothetical protein